MRRFPSIMRQSFRHLGHWLCGVFVGLTVTSAPVGAAPDSVTGNFPAKIVLQDGKLTTRVMGMPLRQVMEEVSRVSGAQIRWLSVVGEETVSVEFSALPFSEALRRILG